MPATSSVTDLVTIRLPKEVVARAKTNAEKQNRSLSNYLARILVTQITRKR